MGNLWPQDDAPGGHAVEKGRCRVEGLVVTGFRVMMPASFA